MLVTGGFRLDKAKRKQFSYLRRKKRVRRKINGTIERPRLAVNRSLKHIYAQIIDDENGETLVHASSLSPEVKGNTTDSGKIEIAQNVGQLIAQKAKERNIEGVIFDRAGYLYHGRIKALAEAAREGGLKF
ncbi:50S ribosomal protein L18 [Candidatus Poribacteria bacterium]|nr:50S ribosomal protein L18 [Candidatus Poribacteria bacterium]MYF56808.1 50S ribosomal protein L18 [Candidatus Poribacteria bacterium]MYI94806.1 50S ribosomal protein L18 [Candidatus Poribacteria bacterium]